MKGGIELSALHFKELDYVTHSFNMLHTKTQAAHLSK